MDHNKLWKILREKGMLDHLNHFLRTCMQVKKQQLEMDMEQRTGSKLGKKYVKAIHCHPAYLTYMQSTSCEILGWMTQKIESRLLGEISQSQICRRCHSNGRKQRETLEPLDEGLSPHLPPQPE